jgi:hypothetical protein
MITDEEIDEALLANTTDEWRKVAFVIGTAMMQFDSKDRAEQTDLYFLDRITVLVDRGLIAHNGDLNQMRSCEIKLL